jgi:hypothetical protein
LLTTTKTIGAGPQGAHGVHSRRAINEHNVDTARDQIASDLIRDLKATSIPADLDRNIAAVGPAGFGQLSTEHVDPAETFRIAGGNRHHDADPFRLSRCCLRQADPRDTKDACHARGGQPGSELTPVYGLIHCALSAGSKAIACSPVRPPHSK